ncbi:hypothetical protein [Oceanobacillus arenosus]|nr:hypothetical protein [Oceanobacillus arenosus]
MEKTVSERLLELAEMLYRKAEEIKMKTQGAETDVNTTEHKKLSE